MSLSAHAIIDDFARSSMNCPPSPARITTTAAVEARIAGAFVRSRGMHDGSKKGVIWNLDRSWRRS